MFIEFDLDGEVVRSGTSYSEEKISEENTLVFYAPEDKINPSEVYFSNGAVRWYTAEQLALKKAGSLLYGDWSNQSMQWIPHENYEVMWAGVKEQRNVLLKESDWTQLPDVPLTTKEAWAAYRQQLRDITGQPDPFNITWPTPPN